MRAAAAVLGIVATAFAEPAEEGANRYAGAETCARCHEAEAAQWRASAHARHGIPVAAPEGGADAAVGSRWMQAYLRRDASGHHRILPRCRDLREDTWLPVVTVLEAIRGDASGFPEVPLPPLEARSFEIDCAGCHTSRPRLEIEPQSGRLRSSWGDIAIDCEACHGPGAAHAAAWARLDSTEPMPRLERLPRRAATGVCARCHGGPPAGSDFAPADAGLYVPHLDDRIGFFPDGTASGQIYQAAGFAQSACNLHCGDCHEPHGPSLRRFAHEDAMCTRCHEAQASRAHTFHDPRGKGGRCIECHMPRLLAGVMAHQRDHRIRSPLPHSPHVPDACTACHKDKDKAWAASAYAERWGDPDAATLRAIQAIRLARGRNPDAAPLLREALSHPNPFFRANAAIYLRDAESALKDPDPAVRLAGVRAAARGEDPERWLAEALRDGEPMVRATALLDRIALGHPVDESSRQDLAAAARLLRDAPEARLALGVWLLRDGAHAEAASMFQGALAFRPRMHEAWHGLSAALAHLWREDDARAALGRRADSLLAEFLRASGDAALAVATAAALFDAGRPEEAGGVLRRAAERQPPGATRDQLLQMLRRLEAP